MATKIVTKNSSTASAVPTASDLVQGELAVNVVDKRLFTENNAGAIVELGTNPSTIDINAGTIDGAVVGGTTPAAITGSTVTSTGNIVVSGTVDGRDVGTDGTKLDGIEASADVTDTTNVTAAGALMDSEVTNLAQVKAFDSSDYATAAQGTKVDGIEAGADVTDTANVTAAGALMDSELTSEASVKALNQGVATTDSPAFAGLTVDTTTLAVDSTNNRVGIGTATPSTILDVKGAAARIRISDTDTSGTTGIEFVDSGGTKDAEIEVGNSTQYLAFKTATAERMRIEGSTVSTTGSIAVGRTSLSAATEDAGIVLSSSGFIYSVRNGTSNQTHIAFINNADVTATTAGSIKTSGSTTSYNTSSDYRLKTDAQPMTGATDRLKALNPVNFEWIADGTRVDGFLAHEAQAVVPECVSGEKDAMMEEEYEVTPEVLDEEGNTVEEAVMGTRSVPDYQGIDQSKLVPLLVATIQELEARITQIENS